MIWQDWHMLIVGLERDIGAVFLKRIITVASHLVMCIWDTFTAVDAPLFALFSKLKFFSVVL